MTVANKNVVTVAFGNKENSLNYKSFTLFLVIYIELKNRCEVKIYLKTYYLRDDIKFQNGTHQFQYYPLSRRKYLKNLEHQNVEGKFPEKDNEILIGDLHIATSMNVGDTDY